MTIRWFSIWYWILADENVRKYRRRKKPSGKNIDFFFPQSHRRCKFYEHGPHKCHTSCFVKLIYNIQHIFIPVHKQSVDRSSIYCCHHFSQPFSHDFRYFFFSSYLSNWTSLIVAIFSKSSELLLSIFCSQTFCRFFSYYKKEIRTTPLSFWKEFRIYWNVLLQGMYGRVKVML